MTSYVVINESPAHPGTWLAGAVYTALAPAQRFANYWTREFEQFNAKYLVATATTKYEIGDEVQLVDVVVIGEGKVKE
jgi:hypothetical protein